MRSTAAFCFLLLLAPAFAAADSEDASLSFAMAKLLADEGSFREALESFEKAASAAPEDPYIRTEYAEFLTRLAQLSRSPRYRQQQLGRALEQARVAQQLAPADTDVLKVVGETFLAVAEADPRDPTPLQEAVGVFEKIRQASPNALGERMTLGQIYSYLGEPEKAIPVFREVVSASPRDRRAYERLVQALLATGRTEEAEAAFSEILDFDPEADEARLSLAELLAQRGEAEAAVEVLRGGTAEFQSGDKIRQLLAVQLYLSGEFPAALEELAAIEGEEEGEESMGALRALILSAQGLNEEAAEALEGLLREDPANADIAGALSRVLVRMGRNQDAATALQEVTLRIEEEDKDRGLRLRFEWADVLLGAEDWLAAFEVLQPVVTSERPQLRAAAGQLQAEALSRLGRRQEALELLRKTGAGDTSSRAKEAEILLESGSAAAGTGILTDLAASGDETAIIAAASVYQRLERYGDAVEMLGPFVEENPKSLRALFLLGAANERSGRRPEAVAAFRELLELDPEFPEALNYLGYMFAEKGENLEEAEQLILKAVRAEQENGAFVDSLGWVYFQMGRYEEARELLERAVRLIPGDGTILEHLGDTYLALGLEGDAREAYLKALELEDTDAEQVRQKLAPLAEKPDSED